MLWRLRYYVSVRPSPNANIMIINQNELVAKVAKWQSRSSVSRYDTNDRNITSKAIQSRERLIRDGTTSTTGRDDSSERTIIVNLAKRYHQLDGSIELETVMNDCILQFNEHQKIGLMKQENQLMVVNLSHNRIGDTGASIVAFSLLHSQDCISDNIRITGLQLESNMINAYGAQILSDQIYSNCTLQDLGLGCNEIGDEGVQSIANSLRNNSTMKRLVLKYNGIGNVGASALGDMLRINASLVDLNLRGNQIGNDGVIAVAVGLRRNTALKKLYLGKNNIGDNGICELASSVSRHQHSLCSLKILDLQDNPKISNVGAAALASALVANTTLQILNITGCHMIGTRGIEALTLSLEYSNDTLRSLNVMNSSGSTTASLLIQNLNRILELNKIGGHYPWNKVYAWLCLHWVSKLKVA